MYDGNTHKLCMVLLLLLLLLGGVGCCMGGLRTSCLCVCARVYMYVC